jgi:hypothetical protein
MMIALYNKWIVKDKGFRTNALSSMPQVLCYPKKARSKGHWSITTD